MDFSKYKPLKKGGAKKSGRDFVFYQKKARAFWTTDQNYFWSATGSTREQWKQEQKNCSRCWGVMGRCIRMTCKSFWVTRGLKKPKDTPICRLSILLKRSISCRLGVPRHQHLRKFRLQQQSKKRIWSQLRPNRAFCGWSVPPKFECVRWFSCPILPILEKELEEKGH